jgi:DNA-binding NtrC family response regulator
MKTHNRILFVDDDPSILQGIQRSLRGCESEWDMSFADDGQTALRMMSQNPPDVVVSDMKMPGMTGDVLISKIRHRFPRTRYIVLSGACDQSSAYRLIGESHVFLAKPCDMGLLRDTIKACLPINDNGGERPWTKTSPSDPDLQGDTVLVVENSSLQGRIIAERLKAMTGVQVAVTKSMAEARDVIDNNRERIFMCVTAMFLSDATGGEVIDMVHSYNLPCVVLTSSHDEGIQSQSRSKPILDYFLKEDLFDHSKLFDLVRRTWDNGRSKVLVVDDSRTDRQLAAGLLRAMNFKVVTAGSGEAGLEALEEDSSIRLVLTDNQMPGISGVELTAELRRRHGDDKIVAIGMSSAADVSARFLKAGCDDFIKKPFGPEEFFCRIQQNLSFSDKFHEIKRLNGQVTEEKAQSDGLLRNILPEHVAAELKTTGSVRPVKHDNVSIMFADFVGFTERAEKMPSSKLVDILGYYYGRFDDIMSSFWIEKIKTIGDCYMCVAGLNGNSGSHAEEALNTARAMLKAAETLPPDLLDDEMAPWQLRIGIHTGPAVAGVVGKHKFAFDIWGDAVNTAARVEAAGLPGRINISETTRSLLGDKVYAESRGFIKIKGKGSMEMFFVD